MSHDTASMAARYVQRGWYVVQLHDVSAGHCSCLMGPECKVAGKHPVISAWQARPLDNESKVRQEWAKRPAANVGIATGPASGVWVLDVDPDHGGHETLKSLVEQHGMLPETYTVWTGGKGTHYYFQTPTGWDVLNSIGRLGPGLDVRGRGGQVVAPPSTTSRGPYSVEVDAPVAVAPPWLLELVKPREHATAMAAGGAAPYVAPYQRTAQHEGYDRAVAYAREGSEQELYELASCPPGRRNGTAFSVACRLVEFVNAPWSGLTHDVARQGFLYAASQANSDGQFGFSEHDQIWTKAVRRVGAKQADLPPADYLGEVTSWGIPAATVDFSARPSGAIGTTAPYVPPMATATYDPFTDPGESIPAQPTHSPTHSLTVPPLLPADPFELAVSKAMLRIVAEREAKRRIKMAEPQGPSFLDLMLTDDQLDEIPEPEPLIEGWLYRDSLARMWGPSGGGKSFVAVEIACCVSTGRAWHGTPVAKGRVVYVVAEGAAGMKKRRQAWQERQEWPGSTGVCWLTLPVQVMGPEWDRFVSEIASLKPALVIFDTQAKVTVGVDENDNTAMGQVVEQLSNLRVATGACVLLVHHQGAGEADRARGATAVKGAMETEISISKRPGQSLITVRNPKQKDVAEAPDLTLTMVTTGRSVVLVSAAEASVGADGFVDPATPGMPAGERRALILAEVMQADFGAGNGGTKAEILAAWRAHPSNEGRTVASLRVEGARAWTRLEGLGRIAVNPTARSRFKFAEIAGLATLDPNPEPMDDRDWHIFSEADSDKGHKGAHNKRHNKGVVTH